VIASDAGSLRRPLFWIDVPLKEKRIEPTFSPDKTARFAVLCDFAVDCWLILWQGVDNNLD